MKTITKIVFFFTMAVFFTSCMSNKKVAEMEADWKKQLDLANEQLGQCGESLIELQNKLNSAQQDNVRLQGELLSAQNTIEIREEQVNDLKAQVGKTMEQVGDLTVLSQSANENIRETLSQLEGKDKYIKLLQNAKTKADSINLALAVNLKGALADGIEDQDVQITVDKTVVMINLSNKMLYKSGSANLTSRANEVLAKIAKIVESRPDVEVMVEGHTDNVPIKTSGIKDNWDLSVKRATSVVRALQDKHNIEPAKLVAAGRGEYMPIASNETVEGRATNRRTRIIIMPKLDQFYDLLNPDKVPD
ncbi:MAG: OmpA family protein [Bacteroidota bacterium]